MAAFMVILCLFVLWFFYTCKDSTMRFNYMHPCSHQWGHRGQILCKINGNVVAGSWHGDEFMLHYICMFYCTLILRFVYQSWVSLVYLWSAYIPDIRSCLSISCKYRLIYSKLFIVTYIVFKVIWRSNMVDFYCNRKKCDLSQWLLDTFCIPLSFCFS